MTRPNIHQAALNAGEAAVSAALHRGDIEYWQIARCALEAALPIALADELTSIADQILSAVKSETNDMAASGLIQAYTTIRERATQLQGAVTYYAIVTSDPYTKQQCRYDLPGSPAEAKQEARVRHGRRFGVDIADVTARNYGAVPGVPDER